jgi:arabinofuranan 3-O-arabinosyltransferase
MLFINFWPRIASAVSRTWKAPASRPDLLYASAYCWIFVASAAYAMDLLQQTTRGLTNGAGRPLGDDFINYWSAPSLAWSGRARDVYDWQAFHLFQQNIVGAHLQFYHYSYPPVMLLLSAPLAALPYLPGLAAWLIASWIAFYRALRLAAPRGAALLSLATPAFLLNAVGGQNGAWTAALLGGGLSLLERRPAIAGVLFGLMAYKPHLAILLPLALAAGRQWRAMVFASLTVGLLAFASVMFFGIEIWRDYLHNTEVLRTEILEDGTGVWHRMMSVFVMARHCGLDVAHAYALQAMAGCAAAGIILVVWSRPAAPELRNASLLLGTCFATPYLQDYDLVFGAFVAAWLVRRAAASDGDRALAAIPGVLAILAVSCRAALQPHGHRDRSAVFRAGLCNSRKASFNANAAQPAPRRSRR